MEVQNKLKIDDLQKWIAIVPGILIFFGLEELLVYYYLLFNIDILEYITVSDALITALDYLIYFAIVMLITGWFTRYYFDKKVLAIKEKVNGFKRGDVLKEEESKWAKKITRKLLVQIILLSIFSLFFFIVVLRILIENYELPVLSILGLGFFLLLGLGLILWVVFSFGKLSEFYGWGKQGVILRDSATVFTAFVVFIFFSSMLSAVKIINGNSIGHVQNIIMNDNSKIELDSNLVYIGRIENFSFLYNKSSSERKLLKNSDIKSYEYKKYIK